MRLSVFEKGLSLTNTKGDVVQAVKERQPDTRQGVCLGLLVVYAKRLLERRHRLGGREGLVVEAIVERRQGDKADGEEEASVEILCAIAHRREERSHDDVGMRDGRCRGVSMAASRSGQKTVAGAEWAKRQMLNDRQDADSVFISIVCYSSKLR